MGVAKVDTNKLETKLETKQYIVVNIGEEQYGIDISYVDNISVTLELLLSSAS